MYMTLNVDALTVVPHIEIITGSELTLMLILLRLGLLDLVQ